MRQTHYWFYPFCLLVLFAFSGCLTADHKEVRLSLDPNGKSGHGLIIFSKISSSVGDTSDVSKQDFNSLVAEYYQGRRIEIENTGMKNVKKKLYKAEGQLIGEISFDFDDVSTLGVLRYKNGPYMYYTISDGFFTSGLYETSNGSYMGEKLPVIFWDTDERDLNFKMSLTTAQEAHKSLIPYYDAWQASLR